MHRDNTLRLPIDRYELLVVLLVITAKGRDNILFSLESDLHRHHMYAPRLIDRGSPIVRNTKMPQAFVPGVILLVDVLVEHRNASCGGCPHVVHKVHQKLTREVVRASVQLPDAFFRACLVDGQPALCFSLNLYIDLCLSSVCSNCWLFSGKV